MMEDDGLERVEWMMGHSARGRDKGYLDRDGAFHFTCLIFFRLSFLFPLCFLHLDTQSGYTFDFYRRLSLSVAAQGGAGP
jgi:hypothetical protein